MLRRSSLSASVAMRQLAQRAQAPAGASASAAAAPADASRVEVSSLDLSVAPPARFRAIAAKTRELPAERVPFAATEDPSNPALLAAQAKDAALLAKVVEDFFKHAGGNWQLEFSTLKLEQAEAKANQAQDSDYLASLALARGASLHGIPSVH